MTLGSLLILSVLAGTPDVDALRRELEAVASRIEQLKARRLAGESVEGELQPLLVRSQELAEELEEARQPPPAAKGPAAPDPARDQVETLRDRASALRFEADRLAMRLAKLEAHIAAVLRSATAPPAAADEDEPEVPRARLAATGPSGRASPARPAPNAIAELVGERHLLELRIHTLDGEAARLDAVADALEREQGM